MSSNADSPISLNSLDINDFDTPTDRIKASAFLASVTTVLDDKQPCRTDYLVQELLTSAHPRRCFEVLRMSIDTFYALRDWLLANTELRSSRKVEGVTIEEKLVIFLYIVTRDSTNRDCQERFAHSGETITR